MARDVSSIQPFPVDADALWTPVGLDRYVERDIPPLPDAPQREGGAVAEDGTLAAGEDRGHRALLGGDGRCAYGVHTWVLAV